MRIRLIVLFALAGMLNHGSLVVRADQTQQVADPGVMALIAQADQASNAMRIDEAQARADEARALAEKLGDRVGLAMAYQTKGNVLLRASLTVEALTWLERALAGFEALNNRQGMATALSGIANGSLVLGNNTRAREAAQRSAALFLETGDLVGRGGVLLHLVRTETQEKADAIIAEVLQIAEKLGNEFLKTNGLRALGASQFNHNELDGARRSFEGAIVLLEKQGDIEGLAATYLSLGRVFRAHGDYEGALVRYQKAVDLLAPTKERYTIVEALNASAIALSFLNRQPEANATYERGLALARESGNERVINFMLGNLAGGLANAGEYARAIPLFEQVIAAKPEPYLAAFWYSNLADSLLHVGRAQEALGPMEESLRITRELKQVEQLDQRLDGRAEILAKLGRSEEALVDTREALALIEQTRDRLIPSDFLKRGFADRTQKYYARAVDLLSRLDRGVEALEVAEQGRARAFLDLLAARESPDVTLPTRGSESLASESIGHPTNAAGMSRIAERLGSTVVAYWVSEEATQIWVIRPGVATTHTRVAITRDKLAALVAATTAPLRETAAGATRGADASATSGTPVQATDDALAGLPMRGLGLLALTRDDKKSWRELYKTLIDPIRAQLPARGGRVTIIPHGPLFSLSFAALQSSTGRYAIEDYDLHFAPSISVLDFTGRRQAAVSANKTGPWALVGDPASLPMVGKKPLTPLPGAAREIAAIAAIAPNGGAMRLEGARADEAALVRLLNASHPSVLHLATHGFVFDDPKTPPFLALNRRGDSAADDGRLTLDEVYSLRLETDLVVLSACRSGAGSVSTDGIVGLTRGFFYAGAPSVLATFWDVTDETTAILMPAFYRQYARAHQKSSSLRTAQLALIADLRAGRVVVTAGGRRVTLPEHPLLWAAFFLSGEP